MTVPEAAEALAISRSKLYELLADAGRCGQCGLLANPSVRKAPSKIGKGL